MVAAPSLVSAEEQAAANDASDGEDNSCDDEDAEPVTSYADVLDWYRSARRSMPGPHLLLSREQAVLYRQLQTNSVLTPALARYMCPDVYNSEKCSVCKSATATLTQPCGLHLRQAEGHCTDLDGAKRSFGKRLSHGVLEWARTCER